MQFFASKIAMVIYGALGGAVTTLVGQKVYKVVTEDKPKVFNEKAVNKLSAESKKKLKDLADEAGI
jgi:hypothetical protein